MRTCKPVLFFISLSAAALSSASAQTAKSLRADRGQPAERRSEGPSFSATHEVAVSLSVRLLQAHPRHRGEVWLEVGAESSGEPGGVTIRIPLSSTRDAYGESRSCVGGPGGGYEPTFTAGLDEKNFVAFRKAATNSHLHFLLNKYLCRALATPYNCFGHKLALEADWQKWRFSKLSLLQLSSDAPSAMAATPIKITSSAKPFDFAKCAVIAPSNGLCCVQHKTTEWHCGGTPAGTGWHQVSGDCFHRETGGTCTE